LNVTFIKFRRR